MRRKNCVVQPRDLTHAIELCLDHALKKKNLSTAGVADLIGLASINTFYKYLANGSLPARLIKPFENVCGADYISRWLVISSGKLVIAPPKGRKGDAEDMQVLQLAQNDASSGLIRFYKGEASADEVLALVQTALERLAWHKGNVEKYQQPELPFDEDD